MSTRLERLVSLLDTGSTPAVRRAAAEQLGDIQKAYPHELFNLLGRVKVHLRSKSWDTRVAAGQAIEAIVRHVPQWLPPSEQDADVSTVDATYLNGKLLFSNFDMNRILAKGALLLASAGKEYDVDLTAMDRGKRLVEQRSQLRQRLGLDNNFGSDDGVASFVDDTDVDSHTVSEATQSKIREEASGLEKAAEFAVELGNLSARERHRLKRKARLAGDKEPHTHDPAHHSLSSTAAALAHRQDTVKRTRADAIVMTEQTEADKVVVETLSRYDLEALDEWPFEELCEQLSQDLFDPVWEIRHGAAMGLRDLIKVHVHGAGRSAHVPPQLNEQRHQAWLEDVSIRCLCLLALDRFVDMSTDPAVAPVRESCAQALGALMHDMPLSLVHSVCDALLHLQGCAVWEVRHAGLLGVKYLLAVRQDLASTLLPVLFPHLLKGLQDKDDDVRAVSADALIPVAHQLYADVSRHAQPLLDVLWRMLPLEELTASVASIMHLLSRLFSCHPLDQIVYDINECLPRLWPYVRDALGIVRSATLTTLRALLSTDRGTLSAEHQETTFRLLWQSVLMEENETSMTLSVSLIELLVRRYPAICVSHATLNACFQLLATPLTARYALSLLITAQRHGTVSIAVPRSEDTVGVPDPHIVSSEQLFRNRVAAAKALSFLLAARIDQSLEESDDDAVRRALSEGLFQSSVAVYRQLCAVLLTETLQKVQRVEKRETWAKGWMTPLYAFLESVDSSTTPASAPFYELQPYVSQLSAECMAWYHQLLHEYKIDRTRLTALTHPDPFLVAQHLLDRTQHMDTLCAQIVSTQKRAELEEAYIAKVAHVQAALRAFHTEKEWLMLALSGTFAQATMAMVAVGAGVLPDKLNPLIRALMNAVKLEQSALLQQRSATALALLFDALRTRDKNPTAKILRNLLGMLLLPQQSPTGEATAVSVRGATLSLHALAQQFAGELWRALPSLYDMIHGPLNDAVGQYCPSDALSLSASAAVTESSLDALYALSVSMTTVTDSSSQQRAAASTESSVTQEPLQTSLLKSDEICLALRILAAGAAALHTSLLSTTVCVDWLPLLLRLAIHSHHHHDSFSSSEGGLCVLAAEAVAAVADCAATQAMSVILPATLSALRHPSVACRRGAMACIHAVVLRLDTRILPYLVLFLIPVLGRTTDADTEVRDRATATFARLVPLLPLDSGSNTEDANLSEAWLRRKKGARTFVEQLLNPTALTPYEIGVPVHADLRHYQREGINWLGFLCRYQLHGILCDDMGLGKTLQTLCVVASERRRTGDTRPSLVVCPPTVAGHWQQETERFVGESVCAQLYMGTVQERAQRLSQLQKTQWQQCGLLITSYEVVRHDIEALAKVPFLFCILDEGHLIKNPRTKLTQAVKRLQAQHRLLLSGTPIQNNVLELWSLFDYLMPGFLGTERQFSERFARPILASRDAKASSREQEAGTLALDRLHKQVLPFLLRRLKEEVLQDLPPKIIQDRYCELVPLQRRLYEHFSRSQKASLNDASAQHIFTALQYLRKVCNHPALVLNAEHPEWQAVQTELSQHKKTLTDISWSPKLMALREILMECGMSERESSSSVAHGNGQGGTDEEITEGTGRENNSASTSTVMPHRVLVFAQTKGMLDLVERELFRKRMPYVSFLRLDGAVEARQRQRIVNQFNGDPSIDVLLLTTHVGGLGLNLTGADTVVFIDHDWNPQRDLQAMDRAHRLGQKRVVNVFRLITRGTLEEKIMGLQKFKMHLANTVMNADNASLQTMSTDQLLDLFSVGEAKERTATAAAGEQTSAERTLSAEKRGPTGAMSRVLENLEELWDTQQYEEEYNVDAFIASLKK